jgi:hypothetical protein
MKPVEQAIFTSVETDRETGYRVVASSAGVCEADARELAVWEPSHDSMLDMDPDSESINFHPLPSGAYCISRTTSAGGDISGRQRAHTHCLIVPTEVLARFANHPLALARAISEHRLWQSPNAPCPPLKPFALPGGATPVDQALLTQLAWDVGPHKMATLVQAVRDAVCLAIAGTSKPVPLIAGLFSCLPAECRLEFSFSTGLKFSPRRPFRIVALSDDPAEQLWVANYPNVTVLELEKSESPVSAPRDGWTRLIERALTLEHIPFLAAQISKRRFDLSLHDLPALGLQLLENLDDAAFFDDDLIVETPQSCLPKNGDQRAHSAHRKFEKTLEAVTATLAAKAPHSSHAGLYSPEILEKLEHLDDLVYEAIRGQTDSLDKLRVAWPKMLGELGETVLAESREQYLRYALSIWEDCADANGVRNPARAIQALDVLCLLFGDVV